MKRNFLLFIVFALFTSSFAQYGYHCGSDFISLDPINTSICFAKYEDYSALNKALKKMGKSDCITIIDDNYCFIDTILTKEVKPIYESNIYKSKHGYTTIVLPQIIVSVAEANDIDKLLELYRDVLFLIKEKKDRCVLGCICNSSEDILHIVQEIEKIDNVQWCKPGMLSEIKYESNNPLFSDQYYLQNTPSYGGSENSAINAVKAWEIVSGNPNIKVAVIDQGVERNHEDLQGAVLDGYTCDNPTESGDPINDNIYDRKGHGTACAGIIAAIDNNNGIKGVASGVKILPINISPYYVTRYFDYTINDYVYQHIMSDPEDIADAIDWAVDNGADVISCSWSHEEDTCITNHLNDALIQGRSGKGCVIVAASGNGGNYAPGFPSNLSGVLCVGAIQRNCTVWPYSQRGPSLDLVAPSGNINFTGDVVTTDRMGNLGYNPPVDNGTELTNTNYTQRFGGTSAACPQVAGVVALMLSANPNLTQSEVVSILRNTATKLPGMNGLSRTDAYGYGLVNAHAAVVQAYQFSISGPDEPCGNSVYSVTNLPSGFTVDWSLSPNVTVLNNSILTTNSPQQNQCSIYNDAVLPWATNLCATIKNPSGVTVTTLMKYIRNTFDLTYSQNGSGGYASIPPTAVESDETIAVNCGCFITLTSPVFAGMNITHTGASPFGFSAFGNTVNFQFANGTNNQWMTIRGSDGCKVLKLKVGVTSNPNLPLPMLVVNPVDDGFELLLTYEGDEEAVKSMMARLQDMEWELNITNATSGEKVQSVLVKGPKTTVRTAGWKSGVYVLQAVVDGQECNKKITVK